MRLLVILILAIGMFFAAAPSWVKEGTAVTYDIYDYNLGSIPAVSQLEYSVFSKSGDDIYIGINTQSCKKIGTYISCPKKDTASETFGTFWMDNSKISGTLVPGMNIAGWQIKELRTFNIAGKEFDAVTFEKQIDGVPIKTTYDKKTGLMLSYNVSQNNHVNNALFRSISPPFEISTPSTPTTQPPATTTQPPTTTTQPPQQTTTQDPILTPTQDTIEEVEIPAIEEPAEPPRRNIPCVPFIFISGFIAIGIMTAKNSMRN